MPLEGESQEEGRRQLRQDRDNALRARDIAGRAVNAAREHLKAVAPDELANFEAARYAFRAADQLFENPAEQG